jgi:hypothetical protein
LPLGGESADLNRSPLDRPTLATVPVRLAYAEDHGCRHQSD